MPRGRIGRDFFKALTGDLDEPRYLRLSFGQRGVLDSALKYQARTSPVQGIFLSPSEEPLSMEDICRALYAVTDSDRRLVEDTFALCVETGLLERDEEGAWLVCDWIERYSTEGAQQTAIREQWKVRSQRSRDKKKQARKQAPKRKNISQIEDHPKHQPAEEA